MGISRSHKMLLLRALAVLSLLFFLYDFISFAQEEYFPLLSYPFVNDIFWLATWQGVCRFGYIAAMVGIYHYRRWGAALFICAWLAQLLPATAIAFNMSDGPGMAHYYAYAQLLIAFALFYWCRDILVGRIIQPLCNVVLFLFALHVAIYLLFQSFGIATTLA